MQPGRRGVHPALERLARRGRRPAGLRPRLGIDGEIDDRVLDRLVRRRALAGADGEDEALPADRAADGRLELQGLGGDLVQRLQHGDVVTGAANRRLDGLLCDLGLGRRRGLHLLGVDRRGDQRLRGRHGDGRRLLAADGRGLLRQVARRRDRLGGHKPARQQGGQRDRRDRALKGGGRGGAASHGYSGFQAS
jgi:hypothetical protein